MKSLEEQVAIVTGAGHPKGIGRAIALALAQRGANVAIADLEPCSDALGAVGEEIREHGVEALALSVDVTSRPQVHSVVQTIRDHFGRIDILANNAGVGVGSGSFLELTDADWRLTLEVNLLGVVHMTEEVLPVMCGQGSGVIVNTASLSGLRNIPPTPACYTASKFAVVGLTKALAQEFGPMGIRCNAICPGSVDTQMRETVMDLISQAGETTLKEAEAEENATICLGRPGRPQEIGAVVAFLASPEASYITGAAIPVDGGMTFGL